MEKQLYAYQCKSCGTRTFIHHGYCINCRDRDSFQTFKVNGKGSIFSYTKIFIAEERFQAETPYVIAVIESVEGLKLIARINREDSGKVSIGALVELEGWSGEVPIFKLS